MIDVSENIKTLKPYTPGKPIEEVEREFGIKGSIKLASNENPLGPSPKAVQALIQAVNNIHRYPDGNCYYLKQKLSSKLLLQPDNFFIGNGSCEVIDLITRTFMKPGQEILTSKYAFIIYKLIAQAAGGKVVEVPMTSDLKVDITAICQEITANTAMIFIANPNNPTGTYNSEEEIKDLIVYTKDKDIILVIDQAYQEYVTANDWVDAQKYIQDYPHVMISRTFSKIYGIAAVRCGYGIANKRLIEYMNRVRMSFNVNGLAQTAALAALDDDDHIKVSCETNNLGMSYICQQLDSMKLKYWPSQANFILVDMTKDAADYYKALLKMGVILRPMQGYDLPNTLRISIGTEQENSKAINALKKILA